MFLKIFVGLGILVVANGYQVRECTEGPLPLKLVVPDCTESDDRCPMFRGESGVADITFKVPSDQEAMYVKVVANVAGLPITFPMPDPNVCHSLIQGLCPIDGGEQVTYDMRVPIQKYYPKIVMELEVSVLNEDEDEVLTCFILPIKVTDRQRWIFQKF